MSIRAYRVIAYTRSDDILHPHRLDVYLQKSLADKRKRLIESTWMTHDWFSRCEIKTVFIDQVADQHVVGGFSGRQTVFELRGRGRQIYGHIRAPSQDKATVWYNPEVRQWYPADRC